jgi:NAD(P)-dependent dehydrogenase (short-subunit alcohol dehydrogenase family)
MTARHRIWHPRGMRYVVTGANRGIGLELVRQLLARGEVVEAACREPAQALDLRGLPTRPGAELRIHKCDVASDESVAAFGKALGEGPIDVLVNNAGVLGKMEGLEELDLADALRTYDVNALGAIRVTRAVLPRLRLGRARKIVHISTKMASIADNTSGGAFGYRMSKTALNMASRTMALALRGERILSVVVNPGWVQTDMGGPGAPTSVTDSAKGILLLIEKLRLEDTGEFWDYRGSKIEW